MLHKIKQWLECRWAERETSTSRDEKYQADAQIRADTKLQLKR
jgi:hypothetical protein